MILPRERQSTRPGQLRLTAGTEPTSTRVWRWYCGHCLYGPNTREHDTHCSECNRRRDSYARYEEVLREPYEQAYLSRSSSPSVGATDVSRNQHAHQGLTQLRPDSPANSSPVTRNNQGSFQELLNTQPVVSLTIPSPGIGGSSATSQGLIPQKALSLEENVGSVSSDGPCTPLDSEDNTTSPISSPKNLDTLNLAQLEMESKHESLSAYLSSSDDPWTVYMARELLPGEMPSFSAVTGEPETAPRRRRFSPERLAQVNETRRRGACAECRRQHRTCLPLCPHRSRTIASNSHGTQDRMASSRAASERSRSPASERRNPRGLVLQPRHQHIDRNISVGLEAGQNLPVAATRLGRTRYQVRNSFDSVINQGSPHSLEAALYSDFQQSTIYPNIVRHDAEPQIITQADRPLDESRETHLWMASTITSPEAGPSFGLGDENSLRTSNNHPLDSQSPNPILPPHRPTNHNGEGEVTANFQYETNQVDTPNSVLIDTDLNWNIIHPNLFDDLSSLEEYDVSGLDSARVMREIDAFFDGTDSNSQSFSTPSSENT